MTENSSQPRPYDAVIGGQNPPPVNGAVLGGLEGVKHRIANAPLETQLASLKQALKYGQEGLNLIIQALHHPSSEMQWSAYLLLRERSEPIVKEALQNYIPAIYRELCDLLAAGKWQEADRETSAIMLKLAGREKAGWLRVEDMNRLSKLDLGLIDQFWGEYSQGCFGFSVQKQIWQEVGGNYFRFGDRVGWRSSGAWLNYTQLTFSKAALPGHLPAAHLTWGALKQSQKWLWYGGTEEDVRWFEVKSLLSRQDF